MYKEDGRMYMKYIVADNYIRLQLRYTDSNNAEVIQLGSRYTFRFSLMEFKYSIEHLVYNEEEEESEEEYYNSFNSNDDYVLIGLAGLSLIGMSID